VDVNKPGIYVLEYQALDGAGHWSETLTRTVVVEDSSIPVIFLEGDLQITHEAATPFVDPGYRAEDALEGDLPVQVTGFVNPAIPGVYELIYQAVDSSGNQAVSVKRLINVVDSTAPVITLFGQASLIHEAGTPYIDAGASATDSLDGEVFMEVEGGLNVNVPGIYTLTFYASDNAGNQSLVVRTITVADRTPPVIFMVGNAIMTHEAGTDFDDPGASAGDSLDGEVAVEIKGTVNVELPGVYLITYSAGDIAGNLSQVQRKVTVVDSLAPSVVLKGDANMTHEGATAFTDPGATAADLLDGDLDVTVTGEVNVAQLGVYTLSYKAVDSSGNQMSAVRKVEVVDTTPPVITITAGEVLYHTPGTPYTDQGAKATDSIDGTVLVFKSGQVNIHQLGEYTITYTATDSSGNGAVAQRKVIVPESDAPVVVLLGDAQMEHEAGTPFVDPGASAEDAFDGTLAVEVEGEVDVQSLGTYELTYTATDSSGNQSAPIVRVVKVIDTLGPEVSLKGDAVLSHQAGTAFDDPGATAQDAYEGASDVQVTGSVDAQTLGVYTLTYVSSDDSGNASSLVQRTVEVVDTLAPVITLIGEVNFEMYAGVPYQESGATALDLFEGDVEVNVSGQVDYTLPGNYSLNYSAVDSSGNAASVTRQVKVLDYAVSITPESTWGFVSEEIVVPFKVSGFTAISGVQFSLEWDPDVMTLIEFPFNNTTYPKVSQNKLSGAVFLNKGAGKLAMLWSENDQPDVGRTFEDDTTLFAIHFKLADTADLETNLTLVNSPTPFRIAPADFSNVEAISSPALIRIGNTEPPEITLVGNASITHEAMTAFVDPGYSAFDSVEGNLEVIVTGSVQTDTLGQYELIYSATDRYGNIATRTRIVTVKDTTPPVMTRLGQASLLHPLRMPFAEPGVTALDAFDGTLQVSSQTDLDVDTAGVYPLTYTATDSSGNSATLTRQVEVIPAVSLLMDSVSGVTQHEVAVPFSVKNFANITGMQFTLNWDPTVAQLVTVPSAGNVVKLTQVHQVGPEGNKEPFIAASRFNVIKPGQAAV
ncbi:MAG: immunoglobulin-like domain-containing protein, partial [Limisphaerales bacterium]